MPKDSVDEKILMESFQISLLYTALFLWLAERSRAERLLLLRSGGDWMSVELCQGTAVMVMAILLQRPELGLVHASDVCRHCAVSTGAVSLGPTCDPAK